MSVDRTTERQLMLLPARTAAEASAWGSMCMEYAATYATVHFARDLATVDWRGYERVTIVRPNYWPDDLPVIIKQANPDILLDRIPVDTPEALQLALSVRVYFGWRYGPQGEMDWARLWPPGRALIGLHGRSNGEMEDPDFAVVRAGRIEAVKITTHATLATVRQLRAINPNMFILIRPIVAFSTDGKGRRVSPQEFYDWTVADLDRLVNNDSTLRYVEIHNEPNVTIEGLGAGGANGDEFATWFVDVLNRYRRRYPNLKFGFPGLSPGPTLPGLRQDSTAFLDQAAWAAQYADWVGLHAYWVNEREFTDPALGLAFARYRQRFPEKLLFVTEFGNPNQAKSTVADQYGRYYALLRNVPGLGAAFAYVASTSDPVESPRWAWRDEGGKDMGIAGEIGRRRYLAE